MTKPATCAKAPCKTCPYRQDVPSGIWAAHHYRDLAKYDGEILDQLLAGATAMFGCHQDDGHLCAGWVATHGPENLLAFRVTHEEIHPSVWGYKSPVPVFASGQEACDHGLAELKNPSPRARRAVDRLMRKRGLG